MNRSPADLPDLFRFQSTLGVLLNDLVSAMRERDPEALKAIFQRHYNNAHGSLLVHLGAAISTLNAADKSEINAGDLNQFHWLLQNLADAACVLSDTQQLLRDSTCKTT